MPTNRRRLKPQLSPTALGLVAQRFRALAEPSRLAILQALFDGELSVGAVCERTDLGQANVSRQLARLAREGIVGRRREGTHVLYRIADDSVYQLCELVCGALADRFETAGAQLAGVRR